jgi:hypothetical protein
MNKESNVIKVPPDQQALGLVEVILEQADPRTVNLNQSPLLAAADVALRIGVIQGTAERLAVLLAERDAAVEGLCKGLTRVTEMYHGLNHAVDADSEAFGNCERQPCRQTRAALARVKEAE